MMLYVRLRSEACSTILAASFKSVTVAIRIVSHHPLRRVPAVLPKTTGTLAARKQGC